MPIYRDDEEYTDIRVFERVVGMFDRRPDMQRIVQLGLLANMGHRDDLDDDDDDDEYQNWGAGHSNSHRYPRHPDRSSDRGLNGNHTRISHYLYQPPLHYYTPSFSLVSHQPTVKEKESDSERRARLLQEEKKSKEKAEKKKLKKQRQKERKRLEKEKQNPPQDKEGEGDANQVKEEDGEPVNNESANDPNSSAELMASAKEADSSNSSEGESSEEYSDAKSDYDDAEELDLSSAFVTKAAIIAKQKLEQKSRPEKKSPVKDGHKTSPGKPNEPPELEKEVAAPTFEDNVKISTELANHGNKCASTGDFATAVKYFTDAIKYNPRQFKLFGNRSFCFEKMQEYEKALADAELSLSMCPGWVKGLFRKGRALAGLKRYEEASLAFREVLKLDSSCAEAAQELMRVQITQLMRYGFTREQSSNALIIHGTVEKSLEVLSKLNHRPGAIQTGPRPPAQVANVTGVSPVLSANINPARACAPAPPTQSINPPKTQFNNNPLGLVQNTLNAQSQPTPLPNKAVNGNNNGPQQELFPIWVGNLIFPVSESAMSNLFSKVGTVYSLKVLTYKRCAFINYTKQEHCDEAIRRFHGYEINGNSIAVRYPDRIPHGMGISRSALKADDWHEDYMRINEHGDGRNAYGNRRHGRPYYRGGYKQ